MKASRPMFTAVLCALALSATTVFFSASPAAANHFADVTLEAHHSGKCMGVAGASQAVGAWVVQQTCNPSQSSQEWTFTRLDNGYYTVQAAHSGLCLDLDPANGQANGNWAWQTSCIAGQASQQWRLNQRPNGNFTLIARHSAKCLEVGNGDQAEGEHVVQAPCDGTHPYQEWHLR